jgi:hypothetical protein
VLSINGLIDINGGTLGGSMMRVRIQGSAYAVSVKYTFAGEPVTDERGGG